MTFRHLIDVRFPLPKNIRFYQTPVERVDYFIYLVFLGGVFDLLVFCLLIYSTFYDSPLFILVVLGSIPHVFVA